MIAAVGRTVEARPDSQARPYGETLPAGSSGAYIATPRRAASAHRPPARPMGRANAVVGATAALGAVVTGSLMAVNPDSSSTPVAAADTTSTNLTALDLANASQALAAAPVSTHPTQRGSFSDFNAVSTHTAMLPVTAPSEHTKAADKHDVELLHKAERLADEAAEVHAALSREQFILGGGGKLDDWVRLALIKLDMPQTLAPGIKKIIMKESRGNPKAINNWDSNARAGRPSQGLMQTIPSTYRAYVLPELRHLPITNPVSNITAGVRYMVANYGLPTLLRGGRVDSIGRYLGY